MYYKVTEIPLSERPRERLVNVGAENLSDKELLAILLKTGTKEKDVNMLATELLTTEIRNCKLTVSLRNKRNW